MKKFILSSVLMLGLTFAANANTAKMTAPVIRTELSFSFDQNVCALLIAIIYDCWGIDTSTPGGFAQYQNAVSLCMIATGESQQH